MALHKLLIFLVLFVTLSSLFLLPSNAQNSPQDYVNAHNTPRGLVGVGGMTWDATLANYAQNYANQRIGDCALTHSNGPYGENLAKGSSSTLTGTAAVQLWVNEKTYYYYPSNTCDLGKQCSHYTQVVWRESVRVGCGRARCNDGWYYVVCSYDPPGNWDQELPY